MASSSFLAPRSPSSKPILDLRPSEPAPSAVLLGDARLRPERLLQPFSASKSPLLFYGQNRKAGRAPVYTKSRAPRLQF